MSVSSSDCRQKSSRRLRYVAHHVDDLVVASGDHAFAELARHTRLHVLCYRQSLSKQLRLAATTVSRLDDLLLPVAA